MKDEHKTKAQLIQELTALRQQLDGMVQLKERVLLRSFIDDLPDHIYVKDCQSRFIVANAAVLRVLGITREEEAIGKTDFDFFPAELAAQYYADEQQIIQSGQPLINHEEPVYDQTTHRLTWYLSSKIPLRTSDGTIVGLLGVNRDITEFKETKEALARVHQKREQQAQEKLAEERKLLRLLIDYIPDYVYLKDQDSRFLAANQATADLMGAASPQKLIGKTDYDFFPPELARAYHEQEQTILQTGQPLLNHEDPVPHQKTGEPRWVLSSKFPYRDSAGSIIGIMGISRDITERRKSEEVLRETLERYQIISEMISDYAYAYCVNPDGTFEREWITEDSYTRLTGFPPETLRNTFLLYHPDDAQRAIQDVEKTLRGEPSDGEYRIVTQSGEQRWIYLHRRAVWDDQEQRVVRFYGAAQDITERKKAEEALRESEERYRMVSELISDYAYSYQVLPDGSIQHDWTTDSFTRVTGFTAGDLGNGLGLYHPDDTERVHRDLQRTLMGETNDGEYRILTKSGELRWLHIFRHPLWDDQEQRVVRFYGVAQDITERKKAEEQRLELALQRDRVQLLEELISDISHDIKTPVATIKTYLYLLSQQPDEAKQKHYLYTLETQIARLTRLVEDILTMSRLDKGAQMTQERLDIGMVVSETGRIYQHLASEKKLTLIFDLSSHAPPVKGSPVELSRAVANLVENAIHYTPEGGSVVLRTSIEAREIVLEVRDTGIGISAADLPRIFDRFFRSDKARSTDTGGTGLGLSIVKKIVEAHRGHIEVESRVGQGSVFRVRLPIA